MSNAFLRELENGLVLRPSRPGDAEALAQFNRTIHADDENEGKGLEDWTLDLISGEGPTFAVDDFTVVEDTQTGEIVSSCCLISQTWSYEGIPFHVGRPELVGTKPDYRRRGLVRQQFDLMHQWSAERGELVQVITGIPYYYRQFGYEMALNLSGGRAGYKPNVPALKEDEKEPFTFRPATEADIPFLMATYKRGCERQPINAVWDEALWRYEISGKRNYNINRQALYIIETEEGRKAGFVGIPALKWRGGSMATRYELAEGHSWMAVTPSVIRWLWQKGEEMAVEQNMKQDSFGFWHGEAHPVYQAAASRLPRKRKPYAYYVRVPDLPAFIKTIRPALEKRLSQSHFAGYDGQIKLNFYRNGLGLTFEKGRLSKIEALEHEDPDDCTANFPPLVFLQLLFGYRSMEALDQAYADCYASKEEYAHLLNALFPNKPSDIWPIS
jgi:predicted N-acetyltransferase YhbS